MASLGSTKGLQIPAAVITVVALYGGLVVGPNSTSISGQSATKADSDSSKASPATIILPTVGERDPRRPLQEFWEAADERAGEEFVEDLIKHKASIDLHFLIATAPDPIDSRFGYRFDAVIDDIQMAIESLGWNLDRHWLPWWPPGTQPGRRDTLKPILDPEPSSEKDFELKLPFAGGATLSGRYDLTAASDRPKPGSKSPPGIEK